MKTVLNKGTIGDKLSANAVLIQESAVHNLKSLENIISLVKLNKKRECMLAIDVLKDVFTNVLLPKRELASFHQVGLLLTFLHHFPQHKYKNKSTNVFCHFSIHLNIWIAYKISG
jgi:hypothetical protein